MALPLCSYVRRIIYSTAILGHLVVAARRVRHNVHSIGDSVDDSGLHRVATWDAGDDDAEWLADISATLLTAQEELVVEQDSPLAQASPFSSCNSQWGLDKAVDAFIRPEDLPLKVMGKLAKSGNFLTTPDGRLLVKQVVDTEAANLARWTYEDVLKQRYGETDGGCKGFSESLLIPVTMSFTDATGSDCFVMLNETSRLQQVVGSAWRVQKAYDVKPLPNLSGGHLQKLMRLLQDDFKEADFSHLALWQGWSVVRTHLQRDLDALAALEVVDYSLFVHVLEPTSAANLHLPAGVGPQHGCVRAPRGKAPFVVCFGILDYMTPYTMSRFLESKWKADKFGDYRSFTLRLFDCLGSPDASKCSDYKGLARVLGHDVPMVAFLGTEAFRANYECKVEEPVLSYACPEEEDDHTVYVDVPNPNRTQALDASCRRARLGPVDIPFPRSPEANADYLYSISVPNNGNAEVVGTSYDVLLESTHKQYRYRAAHAAAGRNMSRPMVYDEFEACQKGVKNFATSTMFWGNKKKYADLQNVLWSEKEQSVLVIRGKPAFTSHGWALNRLRQELCFLRTVLYRCEPINGGTVNFDYKHRFGKLQIMQMWPGTYSGDYKAFLEAWFRA